MIVILPFSRHRFALLIPAAFALILLAQQKPANAGGIMPTCLNLDTLTFDCSDIVQARMGAEVAGQELWGGMEATVDEVYKGSLTPGQKITVVGLVDYDVSPNEPRPLILFLKRAALGSDFYYPSPATANDYYPDFSGIKMIEGDRVVRFERPGNPGAYEPIDKYARRNVSLSLPTVEAFMAALARSIAYTNGIRPAMTGTPTIKDEKTLEGVIKTHWPPSGDWSVDISSTAWMQLAKTGDCNAVAETLATVDMYQLSRAPESILDSPAGRRAMVDPDDVYFGGYYGVWLDIPCTLAAGQDGLTASVEPADRTVISRAFSDIFELPLDRNSYASVSDLVRFWKQAGDRPVSVAGAK